MPSKSISTQYKDYLLITDVVTQQRTEAEFDLNSKTWKLPYTIDDSDLTFDGKPLNMLYEENRWQAEHPVYYSRDAYSGQTKKESSKQSRGRSRQK